MRKDTPSYIVGLAKELRNNLTDAEKILWEKIRRKQIEGYRFQRQYPIGRYIVDFYCSKANLVIEVDGEIHKSRENKQNDLIREKEIKSRGIKILRFKNEEIYNSIDEVINEINKTLKLPL